MRLSRNLRQDQMSQVQTAETLDLRRPHRQTAAHHPAVRAVAGRTAASEGDVPSIKIAVDEIETTIAAAATEVAAEDSDNRAADAVIRGGAATIDQAAHANVVDPDLTILRQWKNRWKQSLPSQMKN